MPYAVELSDDAKKQLGELPPKHRAQVVKALRRLADEPRAAAGVKKLAGHELYRLRSGSYRILYAIFDKRLIVLVVKIGHRRDVYRGL